MHEVFNEGVNFEIYYKVFTTLYTVHRNKETGNVMYNICFLLV